MAQRGLDRGDAEARMAAQMSREERLAQADYVVDNSVSLDHLEAEVGRLWDWLLDSRREKGVPARSG